MAALEAAPLTRHGQYLLQRLMVLLLHRLRCFRIAAAGHDRRRYLFARRRRRRHEYLGHHRSPFLYLCSARRFGREETYAASGEREGVHPGQGGVRDVFKLPICCLICLPVCLPACLFACLPATQIVFIE